MLRQEWSQLGFDCNGQAGREHHCRNRARCGRSALLWRDERRAQSDRSSTQNSEIEWMSVRQEVAEEFTKQAGPPVADSSTAVAGSGGRRSLQLINRIFEANRRRAADHPDCKSNHSRRIEVRFHPRGRPQAGLSRLRRDPCAAEGEPEDPNRLRGDLGETRQCPFWSASG
jgi:hypothetical protein